MVAGEIGVFGVIVRYLVEVEKTAELVNVIILHQHMVEMTVLETA